MRFGDFMLTTKFTLLLFVLIFSVPTFAADNHNKTYDVIIVGGGIAGLTAAFYLDNYDLLLLEKEQQVGGRATSGRYKGLSYARGAEYLGTPEGPLKEIISEFGLRLREIPAPADAILSGGKMYFGDYGKAQLLVKKSNVSQLNRFARHTLNVYEKYDDIPELELSKEFQRLDRITASQWFEENHFSPIYSEIYNVTFRGLFGAGSDEISALSAIPEIAFDFEGFEKIDDENTLAEEFADSSNSTEMYSFDHGIAEIPLALGNHLGNRLRTGTTVIEVKRKGDLFAVTCVQTDYSRITYLAESVILATPSVITLKLAENILSEEQRKILRSVNYAPYITIALFSEEPIFNTGFNLAVPDGLIFTDIYDATWISRHYNKQSSNQETSITLIYAAPFSYKDKTLLNMTNKELMQTVLTELDTLLPDSSSRVKGWEINRFPYAYPVMTPGSYQRMTRLHAITGEGLFFAGDYMIYPTFEAAASSGQIAAERVKDWLED